MSIKEELTEDQLKYAVQFLANEHSSLSTGRSGTIFEANGRTNVFLSTVSSTLVALAFIGQVSGIGMAFYVFSLVLFPCLLFIGFVTFHRTLQTGVEDMVCTIGLMRIRHFYVEIVPQLKDYLILSTHDEPEQGGHDEGVSNFTWQIFVTTAGMVAVINSVLAGVFIGLATGAFGLPLFACVGCGIVTLIICEVLQVRYQFRIYAKVDKDFKPKFPSKKAG